MDVLEVCEFVTPKPFPVKTAGFLGVINLRGNVVPIVSMAEKDAGEARLIANPSRDAKLILLLTESAQRFCVVSDGVKKITLPQASSSGGAVDVGGFPVRIIGKKDFETLIGGICDR